MLNNYYAINFLLEEQRENLVNQANLNHKIKVMNTNTNANNYVKQLFQGIQSLFVPLQEKELPTVRTTNCNSTPDCQMC